MITFALIVLVGGAVGYAFALGRERHDSQDD